jgi:hypothetical protein
MANQRVDPGEQQMRLEIMPLAEKPPVLALKGLEPVAEALRLFGAEGVERNPSR